jgi:integrase/recombinase XerD
MNTDAIIDYWSAYMRAQHCTERTIRERGIFLRSMLRHTGATSPLEVTRHQLIIFLGRPDLTGRTKQNYRSTLHTFFTWMQDEELRVDNPAARLPRPRAEKKEPNPVTTVDIQRVLDSGIYGHTVMKVLLYSYQALRASEIAAVAGDSIDWEGRRILTLEGKGRKEVWRPIHPIVWDYAIASGYPRQGHWFPGFKEDSHVRGKSVSNTLCTAFRRAGVLNHTAHDMRKWHATELLEAGVDILTAQYSMRHSDGQSMKAYDRPSDARIRAAGVRLPSVVVPMRRRPLPAAQSSMRVAA